MSKTLNPWHKLFLALTALLLASCSASLTTIRDSGDPAALSGFLSEEESWQREEALKAIANYQVKNLEGQVLSLARDKNEWWWVRAQAITTLGKLNSLQAIPLMIEIAENADHDELRSRAVEALGMTQSPEAKTCLEAIIREEQSYLVRFAAMAALDKYESEPSK